jgi:hypothetical protein
MAKAKILTAANGRPYKLDSTGRARFVSTKAAKQAGWEAPKKKKASKKTTK